MLKNSKELPAVVSQLRYSVGHYQLRLGSGYAQLQAPMTLVLKTC